MLSLPIAKVLTLSVEILISQPSQLLKISDSKEIKIVALNSLREIKSKEYNEQIKEAPITKKLKNKEYMEQVDSPCLNFQPDLAQDKNIIEYKVEVNNYVQE